MSVQIANNIPDLDDVKVEMFAQSLESRITQKGKTVLQGLADFKIVRGESKTVDQYGGIELIENNSQFPDIEEGGLVYDRRKLEWVRYTNAIQFDEADIREIIEDPQSKAAMRLVEAYDRLKDRIILNAIIADVKTGRNGDTVLTAATDGVLTVDATSGLTYEKLLEITENYINNSVYSEGFEMPALCITGTENTQLMQEAEFINQDYSQMFEKNGFYQKKVGEHVILTYGANSINQTQPIVPLESASVRNCISMLRGAVEVGIGLSPRLVIDRLPAKHNTVAIKFSVGIGAVRTQGELCQIVQTTV